MLDSKIKVRQLAKELGVSTKRVLEVAQRLGVDAKSHAKSLELHQANRIRSQFPIHHELRMPTKTAIRRLTNRTAEARKIRNLSASTKQGLERLASRASVWASGNFALFEEIFGDVALAKAFGLMGPFPVGRIEERELVDIPFEASVLLEDIQHNEMILESVSERLRLGSGDDDASLDPDLTRFVSEHPSNRTVFVMMKFASDHRLDEVFRVLGSELNKYGLDAVRADEKNYASSGYLWDSVQVYMKGSDYGVAILENLYADQMNPNVALEYGYMLAKGKKVLLLKERNFETIQADLLGKLWQQFDIAEGESVRAAIRSWMIDLGVRRIKR